MIFLELSKIEPVVLLGRNCYALRTICGYGTYILARLDLPFEAQVCFHAIARPSFTRTVFLVNIVHQTPLYTSVTPPHFGGRAMPKVGLCGNRNGIKTKRSPFELYIKISCLLQSKHSFCIVLP
jgi:hypothetical protein